MGKGRRVGSASKEGRQKVVCVYSGAKIQGGGIGSASSGRSWTTKKKMPKAIAQKKEPGADLQEGND